MTKAELIDGIAEKLDMKKKDVTPVVEEVFTCIEGALAKGEKCTFVGFGVFEVKDRAAREGRSPALVADELAEAVIVGTERVAA